VEQDTQPVLPAKNKGTTLFGAVFGAAATVPT
jgi:hypothetical protein